MTFPFPAEAFREASKDNRPHYVYIFIGMSEQHVVAGEDLPVGEKLILSASFDKDGEDRPRYVGRSLAVARRRQGRRRKRSRHSPASSYRRRGLLGRARWRCRRHASTDFPGVQPWAFTGSTIRRVAIDVSGEPYIDLEREAQAMLMRE